LRNILLAFFSVLPINRYAKLFFIGRGCCEVKKKVLSLQVFSERETGALAVLNSVELSGGISFREAMLLFIFLTMS
jgi:hypothetical protein